MPDPTVPHPTVPHPTVPHPTVPHPTQTDPTQSHPTQGHLTQSHPTQSHPTPGDRLAPARIDPSADVHPDATVGAGSLVWHLAQVREDAVLGEQVVVGRGAYVGPGVRVGSRCKLQNHALVYEPAVLEDGVFVGPAAVLTNDLNPRAVTPDGALKSASDWHAVAVTLREGASVGARAVCVAPVTVGRWALVAAGSVVVRDVPDHALVAGVPARRIGWVGRAGVRLEPEGDPASHWRCPVSGERYRETEVGLVLEG